MLDVEKGLASAVRQFWTVRDQQRLRQGVRSGHKDAGSRAAVTGGKHADGFVRLVADIVSDAGLEDFNVRFAARAERTLPGYFRPTKEWDLVVVADGQLVAVLEVKSQVGSFGNNFNNRVEEALGSATDFWAAFGKGTYAPSARPWLGYLFMLEERAASMRTTRPIKLSPFAVDESFQALSYAKRYEEVCLRLVRERLYDAACFFTSDGDKGRRGEYAEPNSELGIRNFAISLHARAAAFAKLKQS
jgi:hypothetical protein